MTAHLLRTVFINFFKERGHAVIPSASLVPEHDSTVLFTTAGMQPLVPYLLGEQHPGGRRLTNVQKCLRTDDIEQVGDATHGTFFEMLGNWSLGDYWKQEAIVWSYEFLTDVLRLPLDHLAVSVFAGDGDASKDKESINIWQTLGIGKKRIAQLSKKDNWWGPIGQTGPCGPDSEMFFWVGDKPPPEGFDPQDKRWVEIWNDVFMEYNRSSEGVYQPLSQRNVDTGMGLERMLMVLQEKKSIYDIDIYAPLSKAINADTSLPHHRVALDHLRAAIMLVADGVEPSHKDRGYVVRRLIRRAIIKKQSLSSPKQITEVVAFINPLVEAVVGLYGEWYPEIVSRKKRVTEIITEEVARFSQTVDKGLAQFAKVGPRVSGKAAFDLYQSYGFPLSLTIELAGERGWVVDSKGFESEYASHQRQSRAASGHKFGGGLADHSQQVVKGHTATHLLHQALRDALGESVHQTGSNITPERLRFDFTFHRKLTDQELARVENIVKEQIKADLPVRFEMMSVDKARSVKAIGLFDQKYQDQVKVYFIGDYSREFCGGPHVSLTGQIKDFRIIKEEAVAQGIRRIRAQVA